MEKIIDFADIGEFIDAPVKVYSSGMYVRLGFSIAVTVDPEILIVDEIIAVGDEQFQRKCFDYMFELRKRGTTVVLVTHSLGLVQDLCDQAVWLHHGRVQRIGDSRDVVQGYLDLVNDKEAESRPEPSEVTGSHARLGSGEVRIDRTGGSIIARLAGLFRDLLKVFEADGCPGILYRQLILSGRRRQARMPRRDRVAADVPIEQALH